jgi:hypothetical protein
MPKGGGMKSEKEEARVHSAGQVSRDDLVQLLNEDLSGEYQIQYTFLFRRLPASLYSVSTP